ncbi:MAG: chorismate synthase [Bacteroidales bacterium]|nr:chorismate synthase [Bacteroidales bacterium]
MNSFGKLFTLTTFGESHGTAVGGVIDGMPAGIPFDEAFLQAEMARRRPGQSAITTGRQEQDHVEVLSGIFEGQTTGTPIGFEVRNNNQHSQDYENIRNLYRPSHADYTYTQKYGLRDHRGGGRSSARETLSRVVGGAFAKMALRAMGISVQGYTSQVGDIILPGSYLDYDLAVAEQNAVRCPDAATAERMQQLILDVKADGDTIGGVVTCVVRGVPVGLGEPCFDKLHAALGQAMLSINACKGFDYGMGFADCGRRGSEMIDTFVADQGHITTLSNHSGGIQGGISNGQDIYFRCAFKPVATLLREVETVTIDGKATTLQARGRHDPCVLPRAVPIVEAMAAMVILDYYLQYKARLR